MAARAEAGDVDLDVEVAGVADDRTRLHRLQVLQGDGVAVAGHGDEHVAGPGGLRDRQHLVAVHHRLQRPDRVDLADDHPCAHAAGAGRHPVAAPAVADDHQHLAGQQHVGGPQDAVDGGLPGAVAVVEQVLGGGVVDGQQRVGEPALPRQVACPEHPGAGDLGGAEHLAEQVAPVGVQARGEVGAVVDDQGRPGGQDRVDLPVEGLAVGAVDGEHGGSQLVVDGGGDVVLGRQRVGGAQRQLGPAGVQRPAEVGGLGGHVQAGRDAHPFQRPGPGQLGGDRGEHGHAAGGEVDLAPPPGGRGRGPSAWCR